MKWETGTLFTASKDHGANAISVKKTVISDTHFIQFLSMKKTAVSISWIVKLLTISASFPLDDQGQYMHLTE